MNRWEYCGQWASIRGVWGRILEAQEECTKCLLLSTDFQESMLGLLGNIKDLLMLEVMNLNGSACSGGVSGRKEVGICSFQWVPWHLDAALTIPHLEAWSFGALVVARENSEWGGAEGLAGLCGSQPSQCCDPLIQFLMVW